MTQIILSVDNGPGSPRYESRPNGGQDCPRHEWASHLRTDLLSY
jgi:hypothetical protein